MDKDTLRKLEFDKIQNLIANYTSFEGGYNYVINMMPSANIQIVTKRLDETEEAMEFLRFGEPIFFNNIRMINTSIQKAKIHGILSPLELLDVYHLLKSSRLAKKGIDVTKYPNLGAITADIIDNFGLETELSKTITEDGDIRDDATHELRNIRTQINTNKNRIREYLQSFIRAEQNQKFLQDVLITERDGRYVVPVKQESRNEVKGIVHDESSSGATVFIEPLSVVELNNKIRLLQLEEKREIEKILLRLSSEVALIADDILNNLERLSLLDYIFARGRIAYKLNAFRPEINNQGVIEISQGKHPLIGDGAVPLNIELGKRFDVLVITGPNTGGKTVALKTIGLLSIMAMCGLFIPARENSKISVFKSIYVDIGDEQSIEQSLSTFSSHMKNIINIINKADDKSLVLLDELGAGTDPAEGAALARVILEELQSKKAKVVVSTHQSELKTYAYQKERVENACVEFDPISLKPTYELTIGTPGQSNAFEIAKRLGLSSVLVKRAKELVPEADQEISNMIKDLKKTRYQYNELIRQLESEKELLEKEKDMLLVNKKELIQQKEQIIKKAKEEADNYLKQIKAEADLAIKELKAVLKNQNEVPKWHEIEASRRKLKNINLPDNAVHREQNNIDKIEPKPGDYVIIKNVSQKGYVLDVKQDELTVQAGILKLTVNKKDVITTESPDEKQTKIRNNTFLHKAKHISKEIDVRGKLVEEALEIVDKYLEDANLIGLDSIRIIHGKGTGALRKAIREYLKSHSYVKSFRDGFYDEGGIGVTIVDLI